MPITTVKIHPALGIARLGNSPNEFFVGPERPWDRTPPAGGYKDAHCRIKRQAARFRLFGYDQNGTLVKEITVADGAITWTAHLVNRKAAGDGIAGGTTRNPGVTGAARQGLVIDPGSRSLNGANQHAAFDTGVFKVPGGQATVALGEMRTDTQGHLLVLGGFGTSASPNGTAINSTFDNHDWYDDTSDGPITASVTISGTTFTASGAWVVVAPPRYAPPVDNIITLYDRLRDYHIQNGLLPAPGVPSYTKDIYPILQRAPRYAAVYQIPPNKHVWTHPVTNLTIAAGIVSRVRKPDNTGGDMPAIAAGDLNDNHVTATQYAALDQWRNGNFTNDWVGVPTAATSITPSGLDQAALENCVGAAFYPGIEAGRFLVQNPAIYSEPFRLNHATVQPGEVTMRMAVPWQTDFNACGGNWWPAERPSRVTPQGSTTQIDWAASVDMVHDWHTLGIVVEQGGALVEVDRCGSTFVSLLTPALNFANVPQGPNGLSRKHALAIVFEVQSASPVTLQIQTPPSHPRIQSLLGTSVTVGPTSGSQVATARLWLTYETGAVGEFITDSVVVSRASTTQQWTVSISANTVARKKAVVGLALDRSGSMSEDRGDGVSKNQSLREAASIFVDVMLEQDAVAIVRYNQDAQLIQGVTALGSPTDVFDAGRAGTKAILSSAQLDPNGSTSIGDGIFEARAALNGAAGYDVKALVVLTDGVENASRYIADVAPQINEQTYAIGLGTVQNTSAVALQTISGNNGGYLLLTGAIAGDTRFLLQKYFLQILAGVSNADVVLDPQGELHLGEVHRIPFQMTEADAGFDAILLSPAVKVIDFRIQTPSGTILDPGFTAGDPRSLYVPSNGVAYYRFGLPVEYMLNRFDGAGTWHAILSLGRPGQNPNAGTPQRSSFFLAASQRDFPLPAADRSSTGQDVSRASLPYSLIVHGYSDINFHATAAQAGYDPGSRVDITAELLVNQAAIDISAHVWADVTPPIGAPFRVDLTQEQPSVFRGGFAAARAGIYRMRVQASGRSPLGWPFRRERTLSATVWFGGNRDATIDPRDRGRRDDLCNLLECVLKSGVLTSDVHTRLRQLGIDVDRLMECLKRQCSETKRVQ